jgi:glutathione S-transferase
MQMAENFNIELDLRDITESEEFLAELIEKGGESQVPFLVDTERGVSMCESNDIIDYLREQSKVSAASESSPVKPRIHMAEDAVCVSCEG